MKKPSQEVFDAGQARASHNRKYMERTVGDQAKQHEVHVWENGDKYVIISDSKVAQAVNGLTAHLGFGWRQAASFTRFWSALTTSQNPMFIVPNIVRDYRFGVRSVVIRYGLKAAANYTAVYNKSSKAAWRAMNGKADPANNKEDALFQTWRDKGGPTGYVQMHKIDKLKKEIDRDLSDLKRVNAKLNPLHYLKVARDWESKWTGRLADWSETIGRFSAFKIALENGDSMDDAVTFSKEITVNFDRKGTSSQHIGSLYAFFNARMQGITRYFKLWGMDPKTMAMFAAMDMAAGVTLSMLLDSFWGDDEDEEGVKKYDKFSSYLRSGYLMIPVPGTDNAISLPNPHGFGAFYALGNIAYDMATGRRSGLKGMGDALNAFSNSMLPVDVSGIVSPTGKPSLRPITPTFLVPALDLSINEDFAGRMIFREPYIKDQNIANSQLYLRNTNSAIRSITDKLYEIGGGDLSVGIKQRITKDGEIKKIKGIFDRNPAKLEHIAEYYLSGKGQFYNKLYKSTIQSMTEVHRKIVEEDMSTNSAVLQTMKEQITEQPGDIPIINRFIRAGYGDPIRDEYYKKRETLGKYLELARKYEAVGNFDKAKLIIESDLMPEASEFSFIDAQIKNLNNMLYDDIPESAKERIKKEIRQLQKQAINFKEK